MYILYILSAGNCAHCVRFERNQLDNLKRVISSKENVELMYIKIDRMGTIPEEEIHPDLKNINEFYYPFIGLFDKDDFYNYNKKLNGDAMGAQFGNGILTIPDHQLFGTKFSTKYNKIWKWCKKLTYIQYFN